jgi:hypothetical protein
MLHNYIKTSLRSLRANKTHSFVNIAGLAAGMAVTILIGLWIWDEVSFDKSNSHYDRIAQVLGHATMNGSVNTFPTQPVPEADVLRNDFGSDFKYVVRSSWNELPSSEIPIPSAN